jgi:predicted phosphodiesterase
MRKWIRIILFFLILAGGAVLCAVRWEAWFAMPAEPKWTEDTLDYVFPYPIEDSLSTKNDLTILVLGDIHNGLNRADYDTLAARVPEADVIAQVGDWMNRGQNYYYQWLLREWTNSALFGKPVIVCPGNHEYSKGLYKTLSPIWEHAFPHPNNGPANVPGAGYFIDLSGIRFIVIDTNPLVRMVYLTRTLTWLRETMYSAGDRFIVVMMHHPVLAVAKGRFNSLEYATFRNALGEADLVIAGHDHSYMRRTPFVVLNTSGKPKTQHPVFVPEVTDSTAVYGVLKISKFKSPISNHKSQMRFTVHRLDDGTQIDSLYVSHD